MKSGWLLAAAVAVLSACQVTPVAPLAARSLLIQGRGTEVRMSAVLLSNLVRSGVIDLASQRLVDDTQLTGHVGFEIDGSNKTNPTVRVFGQDIGGRTVKLKSLGAVAYDGVALDSIPTDAGMATSVAGVKVNDVLLFKVADSHAGEEFGKLILRKATSLVVGFDYALQTDGANEREACPVSPSPDSILPSPTPS